MAKTTNKTKRSRVSRDVSEAKTESSAQKIKNNKFLSRKALIIGLAAILVIALLYYFRGLFIVATVNGKPINRIAYIQELESQAGQQALNAMVTKTLILQEAQKQNVTVSQEEINNEISQVEDQLKDSGQSLDQALQLQGISRKQFEEQIQFQKLIEKMVGKDITVTDEEVNTYVEENQESLPEITEASEEAQLKVSIKDQLQQQKLSERVQEWLENLQENAQINYF